MVETVFTPRTVRLEKIKKDICDVLVAVCSNCDCLKGMVLTIVDQLGVSNPNAGVQTFIRYYLRYLSTDVGLVKAMIALGKYQVLDPLTPKRLKELQFIFRVAA